MADGNKLNELRHDWIEQIHWDEDGLVPVIIQDAYSGEVLTLAYANEEALTKALAEGTTWLYSRSRQQLWRKGESSGNSQQLLEIRYDCDADALLYRVLPSGPACHEGTFSCFRSGTLLRPQQRHGLSLLHHLEATVDERRAAADPKSSYVSSLFHRGRDRILQKVGEEAVEVLLAGKSEDRDAFIYEASDLVFHLTVALRDQGLSWEQIMNELERRQRPAKT